MARKNLCYTEREEGYLTDEEVKDFQRLVWQTKGIKLSFNEASDQALRLVLVTEEYIKFKQNKVDVERYD